MIRIPVRMPFAALATVLGAAALLAGCQTTSTSEAPPPEPESAPITSVPFEFEPSDYRAGLRAGEARYQRLYAPESYAIWVTDEVNGLKLMSDQSAGVVIDDQLKLTAEIIQSQFITIECHLISAFADTSVAYDAVGLRNIEVYFETPAGDRIYPVQRIMAPQADESPQGALVRFGRTTVLVFPKRDLLTRTASPMSGAATSRLVLDGFHSRFYFEWQNAAGETLVESENVGSNFNAQAARDAVRTGYTSLYSILSPLQKIVD